MSETPIVYFQKYKATNIYFIIELKYIFQV